MTVYHSDNFVTVGPYDHDGNRRPSCLHQRTSTHPPHGDDYRSLDPRTPSEQVTRFYSRRRLWGPSSRPSLSGRETQSEATTGTCGHTQTEDSDGSPRDEYSSTCTCIRVGLCKRSSTPTEWSLFNQGFTKDVTDLGRRRDSRFKPRTLRSFSKRKEADFRRSKI